jgi:hypothetical protein
MATTTPPTDEELNTLVLAYLALIGIDLSVLPVNDRSAPADQTRVLSSARSVLRSSVPVISNYVIGVQEHPPALYPAPFSVWTAPDEETP